MSGKFLYSILSWTIPSLVTILGIILQSVINNNLANKNLKRNYKYRIYDNRIEAYQELYKELTKYRRIFEPVSADFLARANYDNLDISVECENLYSFFREREVYFDSELCKVFKGLIFNNKNIAFNILEKTEIVKESNKTIFSIDRCLVLIKKNLGLDEINKAFK